MGAKKRPFYRMVVAPSVSSRGGRFVETLGTYDPLTDPPTVNVKTERALYWLGVGAQPTETAQRLLEQQGIWQQHKATKSSANSA